MANVLLDHWRLNFGAEAFSEKSRRGFEIVPFQYVVPRGRFVKQDTPQQRPLTYPTSSSHLTAVGISTSRQWCVKEWFSW